MRLKLWGVRGSLPAPLEPERMRRRIEDIVARFEELRRSNGVITARSFCEALPQHLLAGYGGNTMCAEITSNTSRLLIDGGTGLRVFCDSVVRGEPSTTDYHIYMTHFHWDHLLGIPFFSPIFEKGKSVHFYAVDENLEGSLRTLFRRPNFPLSYESVKKQIHIHHVEPRMPFHVGDIQVTPYMLDHPDPCWGARVESGGKSVAWAIDTECTRSTVETLGRDQNLYANADVMVFDAQYTFDQAIERVNWGHASGPLGLDLALRESVKTVLFAHHDPSASDETIRQAEEQTLHYAEELLRARRNRGESVPDLIWRFAREGEVIDV